MSQPRAFSEVSRSQQRKRLQVSARNALAGFGMADADLRLINYDFNATYRVVRNDGTRFALRLNVNSARSVEAVKAEAAWVLELSNVADIHVPTPQQTRDGGVVLEVECAGVERPVPAVLYSWLDGPDLGERASLRRLRAMGSLTARLHQQVKAWDRSAELAFGSMDRLLMDEPDALTSLDAPWFVPSKPIILEAFQVAQENSAAVFRGPGAIPIHGDLHVWNTKWVDDHIAVFDFDDAGLGRELQDLSVSAYYLRDRPGAEAALLEGYEEVSPLPKHTPEQWEALIVGRNLVLLNAVVGMVTAGYQDFLPGYVQRTEARLRNYLDTGTYVM